MEATMLKTSSEFPHPGSYALLDGVKVRIIRAERGGDVFVTGEGVARVIASAHLVAFHQDSPIVDQWIDQRVAAVGAGAATPTADAWADFCAWHERSEEHTSELQSLMRISYAVFCLKKKNTIN